MPTTPSRFLKIGSDGLPVEESAIQTSAGAGSAGKYLAARDDGKIDESFLPGETISTVVASEAIAAGSQVNAYSDSGTLKIRLADNSNSRPAHGFAPAAIASAAAGAVYFGRGENSALSGLTVGATYFLGTSGAVVLAAVAPAAGSGCLLQKLGVAISTTTLSQDIKDPITRSA